MTDKAAEQLKSDGWTIVDTTGFISLVGPLWERKVDGVHEYALVTEDKHHNRRGLVQGGVLMTFADRTCGMTARYVSGTPTLATVQLDTHFVEAGKIGEILIVEAARGPRHPQPDLHDHRGDRRRPLRRHGERRVQDIEEGFVTHVVANCAVIPSAMRSDPYARRIESPRLRRLRSSQ